MYAIIQTGGKQYKVKQGDVIDVELLHLEDGSAVEFKDVLMVADGSAIRVGTPTLAGCVVKGELICGTAGEKIDALKYKRRHNEYRRWGHRQHYSRVRINEISEKKK